MLSTFLLSSLLLLGSCLGAPAVSSPMDFVQCAAEPQNLDTQRQFVTQDAHDTLVCDMALPGSLMEAIIQDLRLEEISCRALYPEDIENDASDLIVCEPPLTKLSASYQKTPRGYLVLDGRVSYEEPLYGH